MRVGELVLLPAVRRAQSDTLIVADGFSCREKIEQGSGRRAVHVAQAFQAGIVGQHRICGAPVEDGILGPRAPASSPRELAAGGTYRRRPRGYRVRDVARTADRALTHNESANHSS